VEAVTPIKFVSASKPFIIVAFETDVELEFFSPPCMVCVTIIDGLSRKNLPALWTRQPVDLPPNLLEVAHFIVNGSSVDFLCYVIDGFHFVILLSLLYH
jgi:hypothetical protein